MHNANAHFVLNIVSDIILKSTKDDLEDGSALRITELWIPGLGSGDIDKRYSVSEISSRYWRVDGYVEL